MPTRFATAIFVISLLAAPAGAQQFCPCVPITHLWVVKSCDSWNCAASAFIGAGDANTFTVPTSSVNHPWIVLQRVTTGGGYVTPEDPFTLEHFDGMNDAVARFGAIGSELRPLVVTTPDGKWLVLSLRQAETAVKPHAAVHH